ncbi:MAG TPA: hypothetical protein VM488_03220 [Pseudobacter sp.]|nr:hypothetical protein [Pseudobacter sp.]
MKKYSFFFTFFVCAANGFAATSIQQADSVVLPECIKKLTAPPGKGIRVSFGAKQFRRVHTMENGKTLYVFHSRPSIGCHINEPASTKYYNDSCKMVASFPAKFSMKQGFKPFVAAGYKPEDFPEAAQGDYPAYFAKQEKAKTENRILVSDAKPKDPFPVEKEYTITGVKEDVLNWRKGDVVRISTKNGLKHYRNNKLMNNYKIVPQLTTTRVEAQCRVPPCFTTITKVLVYYMDGIKRFVEIRNNGFMISAEQHESAPAPAKNIDLSWKTAYAVSTK